jgi:hypothetical protein
MNFKFILLFPGPHGKLVVVRVVVDETVAEANNEKRMYILFS